MTQPAPRISRFPVPDLASLPEDIRQAIEKIAEKSGFVPNVFLALAHRPAEFRAFFGMSNRLVNAGDIRPNDEFYMMGRE